MRAGAQFIGQAGGQRAVDEAVATGTAQLDRRMQAVDVGERPAATVQVQGGQQVGIARVAAAQ